jgi:glycosyltransferase involved in cell wall biosynthesis
MKKKPAVDKADDTHVPLISVVLPVYNGEQYLDEAINSILAQTFTDFELIIIDDGSTDGSLAVLQKYQGLDARIRLLARENRSLATTLNDAINIARGAWIARMDQDDIAFPHRFERQIEWLGKTGADITGSWVQRFGTSDKRVVRLQPSDEAIKMEMLFCSPFAHPTVMMRTELASRLRYDSAWEKAEDYDLWERAAEAGWKMTNVPEVLLLYRVHATQISSKTLNRQQQLGLGIRRRYWMFVFNSKKLNQKWIDAVLEIFESPHSEIDMDAVDAAFMGLLESCDGLSREVVFNQATRIYFRAAANCKNIVSRWSNLNRQFGKGGGAATKIKLSMFRWFRIRTDGDLFRQLRKLYVWKASR